MTGLLTWQEAESSGMYSSQTRVGRAGKVHLFSYTWDAVKAEPGAPYVLSTSLPGWTSKRWRGKDGQVLEAKAEALLALWLKYAGLVPEDEQAEYSLSGQDAYTVLTGEYDLSMTGANSLIFLAAAFGETRIPFRGAVLAVGYAEGYYRVTCEQARSTS